MHIDKIELALTNIALFREIEMHIEAGQVLEASGGNGRGKTTLLNSLLVALTGKKINDFTVTLGEDQGVIATKLAGISIRRVIRDGSTYSLEVIDEFGTIIKNSPQSWLNTVFGKGTFLDPIDILKKKPEDRAKAIATALDIDPGKAAAELTAITGREWKISDRGEIFARIKEARDTQYELRRQAHVAALEADAQADGVIDYLPEEWRDPDAVIAPPVEPPALGEVYDQKANAERHNSEREGLARRISELDEELRSQTNYLDGERNTLAGIESELQATPDIEESEIEAVEKEIALLQQKLAAMRSRTVTRAELMRRQEVAKSSIEQLGCRVTAANLQYSEVEQKLLALGPLKNTAALQEQINQHEIKMSEWRGALSIYGERSVRHRDIRRLREQARDLKAKHEDLDAKVKALDKLPLKLLEGVAMPIPGMMISGSDIFIPDGDKLMPIDSLGEADRYSACARIAMKLAPVNLILMDGVERCDDERRNQLYQLIAEAGFCGFSTRVTGGERILCPYNAVGATNE